MVLSTRPAVLHPLLITALTSHLSMATSSSHVKLSLNLLQGLDEEPQTSPSNAVEQAMAGMI